MHVGHTAIFQNPHNDQGVSDYQIYREDMAIAKEAADLGFQSVWGIEHHFTDYIMNPNVTQFLAYMAGYNKTIKVGSMVVVLPWYPAIRVAENMAMLDAMSDGRAVFGMGRGLARVEYEGLQIDQNESTDRFIETAEAVLTGLEQGYVEYDGKLIRQPHARIRPEPFKSFRGRCYAAAVSPASAPILARLGIGMLIIPQKPFPDHLKDVDTHAALYRKVHGAEPPKPIITSYVFCDRSAARAEEYARRYIAGYWREVVKHYELLGTHFKSIKNYEHYQQQAETYDEAGVVDLFLGMQVYGTPEQCYEKIQAQHAMFDICGNVAAFKFAGMPYVDAQASLRLYAKEVMPELRKLGDAAPFDSDEVIPPAFMRERQRRAA
jgi:alkanesulfonate monooxygenase SsuD/methylene tetrahydromethanopterin reductase-like flavin-dependent oxidoreductase (luciferase family)